MIGMVGRWKNERIDIRTSFFGFVFAFIWFVVGTVPWSSGAVLLKTSRQKPDRISWQLKKNEKKKSETLLPDPTEIKNRINTEKNEYSRASNKQWIIRLNHARGVSGGGVAPFVSAQVRVGREHSTTFRKATHERTLAGVDADVGTEG